MSDTPAGSRNRPAAHRLTARPDVPDFRDWPYEPPLIELKRAIARPRTLHILDQGPDGACTGFALAGAINLLAARARRRIRVSPLMLYDMAKRHDEWRGERYEGSSCRGALKGWYNAGVCSEQRWPQRTTRPGLTLERARDARRTTLGAYYRLGHRLSDYHAALNEAGVIYCSATVHAGWDRVDARSGRIHFAADQPGSGGHAFAIVGYNAQGFWIQNSWGRSWGQRGTALWSYADWQAHVMDAWVFRLALPTPQLWQLPPALGSRASRTPAALDAAPARAEIAGHFVHIEDGVFKTRGRYWSSPQDLDVTARFLSQPQRYRHLLLFAHGGLNSPRDSARRIAALVGTFKANGIYPYHIMYDTGLFEELGDLIARRALAGRERAAGIDAWSDRLIEWAMRIPGRALWREIKRSATLAFAPAQAGHRVLEQLLNATAQQPANALRWHLAGHSAGAVLLAQLLRSLESLSPAFRITSCSLLAPASSIDLFKTHYYPQLAAEPRDGGIDRLCVYALSSAQEARDRVAGIYGNSLLHLVSRSCEEIPDLPLLGLARDAATLEAPRFELVVSAEPGTAGARCTARTHGGFDNDVATMNDLLRSILGHPPAVPFTADALRY